MPNKRRGLRYRISRPSELMAMQSQPLRADCYGSVTNILTAYQAFPHGPGSVIMQSEVEKYRYVRARIVRLLAFGNRDSHIRWLSKP